MNAEFAATHPSECPGEFFRNCLDCRFLSRLHGIARMPCLLRRLRLYLRQLPSPTRAFPSKPVSVSRSSGVSKDMSNAGRGSSGCPLGPDNSTDLRLGAMYVASSVNIRARSAIGMVSSRASFAMPAIGSQSSSRNASATSECAHPRELWWRPTVARLDALILRSDAHSQQNLSSLGDHWPVCELLPTEQPNRARS